MQMTYDDELRATFLAKVHTEHARRTYFACNLMNPAFHWFFTQGQQALEQELYIPGVSSILNGIEASLRVTVAQLHPDYAGELTLSPYQNLSNTLLRKARELGVPIKSLAWPGEEDFYTKLETKENVFVVQLRHDVCHGDILQFIEMMEYEQIQLLTPECLRSIAAELLAVSFAWTYDLAGFRARRGLRPAGIEIANPPENPLAAWLPKRSKP
ncbi:hypothetical protein [Caulobacter sp. B11]|uniref:hypothetical protein n=1 Tax=Caulobacter sp. B11 TaxID=2048899 RepID=UPI0011814D8D|nr:hypothetical protein [Caulobacter sp. B11]